MMEEVRNIFISDNIEAFREYLLNGRNVELQEMMNYGYGSDTVRVQCIKYDAVSCFTLLLALGANFRDYLNSYSGIIHYAITYNAYSIFDVIMDLNSELDTGYDYFNLIANGAIVETQFLS